MEKLKKIVIFLVFAMVFGIISAYIPENYVVASNIIDEDMEIKVAPPTEDLEKVWSVEFNKAIKEEDLEDSKWIFVKDPLGEIHETTLSISKDNNKIVLVTPVEPYENYKPYTLYVLKEFGNAEDNQVLSKTVKMDFTIEKQEDIIIDTSEGKIVLENEIIYGDLIINGGGEATLRNVEVKGSIIVNDIGENSLILDNVKATKLEVNDTNGARIFVKEGNISENKQEVTKIGSIEVNGEDSLPIKLEGDFTSTTVNVNQPVEIKIAENTNIKEINIKEEGSKITPEEGVELVNVIGSIAGVIPEEIKAIKEQIDENKNNFDELNAIPHDSREQYKEYLQRGRDMQLIIEKILGPDRLGEDYKNYPEHTKIRTANSIRSLRKNVEITTIAQLEKLFNDAIRWNRIFNEGMKYAAYGAQREANENYEWPVIGKDIEVGADITDIVMKLADGVTEDQLNEEITVTILSLDDLKDNEYYELWAKDYEYFHIDKSNNTVKLAKINNRYESRNLSIMVHIEDIANNSGSITNFNVTLEPQLSDIGEVNLSIIKNIIISEIDNNNWIYTYDNVSVGDFLNAIESENEDDELSVVDSDYVKVDSTKIINGSMMLKITRGESRAYYKIIAMPMIRSNNSDVIKEVSLDRWTIVVHPGKTIEEVRTAIDTNHNYYELDMWYKNGEKIADLSKLVDNNMILFVETGTIETGDSGFGFSIEIYIGEVNLSIKEGKQSVVSSIDNYNKIIHTNDTVTVGDLKDTIVSSNSIDIFEVVDSNNEVITDGNTKINSFMMFRISRGDNKVYYILNARPVLGTKGDTVIKEIKNNRLYVHPGKKVKEVIDQVEPLHEGYVMTIIDENEDIVEDDKLIENGMKLEIWVGRSGYRFSIEIYIEDVEPFEVDFINKDISIIELGIKDESIIKEVDNTPGSQSITVYNDKTVKEVIEAVQTNHEDYYNIYIKDNRYNDGNIISDDSLIVSGEMWLYLEYEGSRDTFLIKTDID